MLGQQEANWRQYHQSISHYHIWVKWSMEYFYIELRVEYCYRWCTNRTLLSNFGPKQHGTHFTTVYDSYESLKCIFIKNDLSIEPKLSIQVVSHVLHNKKSAFIDIMTERWRSDKSLSESMIARFAYAYHITWPRWVVISDMYWIAIASKWV